MSEPTTARPTELVAALVEAGRWASAVISAYALDDERRLDAALKPWDRLTDDQLRTIAEGGDG